MNFENMPHGNVLAGLISNISQACSIISKHPLNQIPEVISEQIDEEEDSKKKKFLQTIVGAEDEKKMKPNHSEALQIMHKISSTPSHKLKNVMFKKMLLKLILYFYEEKMKDKASSEYFCDFVFAMLVKKYIMRKAAESKFNHLLASCIKYKEIIRVRVFGRLLGLYDAFDNDDLRFFIDCLQFVIDSPSGFFDQTQDSLESICVPYVRCVECIKFYERLLPKNGVVSLRLKLEKMKKNDRLNRLGAIDIDEFLEQIVETYNNFNKSTRNFMRSIYEAADLNDDGYLQFKELELLLRYLSEVPYSPSMAAELFEEFSENFLSEEEEEVRAISFNNLCQLNKDHKLFFASSIRNLTGMNSSEEALMALEGIEKSIEDILAEFLWRFTETQQWDDHMDELKTMLESIKLKVMNKTNPETSYLAFKLIDLESKRTLVEEKMHELLPTFCMGIV